MDPAVATVTKLRTSGPTDRTRRLKKARSRSVGGRLRTDHSQATARGFRGERGVRAANCPKAARAKKYAKTVVHFMRQPQGTTRLTVKTTGQEKTHHTARK
jgi:hypothetical protein